jgi:homoserine kinase
MSWPAEAVTAGVPATSANLDPGSGALGLATAQARKALPDTVEHDDPAADAGCGALPAAALTADPAVLLAAAQDLSHQPCRAPVRPATARLAGLAGRLRGAGIPAVVSGAEPSVLAFLGGPTSARLAELGSIVKETGNAWLVSPLDVDRQGASVQFGPPAAKSGHALRKAWPGSGLRQARPGTAASPEPQDRSSFSATHGELSREYRGLSWC